MKMRFPLGGEPNFFVYYCKTIHLSLATVLCILVFANNTQTQNNLMGCLSQHLRFSHLVHRSVLFRRLRAVRPTQRTRPLSFHPQFVGGIGLEFFRIGFFGWLGLGTLCIISSQEDHLFHKEQTLSIKP